MMPSSNEASDGEGAIIVPHFQPHNLHIWYGFFQRYAQGAMSTVPTTGVATGDAIILSLSTRILAMDEEICSLKKQILEMKMRAEGGGGIDLDELTRNHIVSEPMGANDKHDE